MLWTPAPRRRELSAGPAPWATSRGIKIERRDGCLRLHRPDAFAGGRSGEPAALSLRVSRCRGRRRRSRCAVVCRHSQPASTAAIGRRDIAGSRFAVSRETTIVIDKYLSAGYTLGRLSLYALPAARARGWLSRPQPIGAWAFMQHHALCRKYRECRKVQFPLAVHASGAVCGSQRSGEKTFPLSRSCGPSFFGPLQLWQSQPLFRCVNAGI